MKSDYLVAIKKLQLDAFGRSKLGVVIRDIQHYLSFIINKDFFYFVLEDLML